MAIIDVLRGLLGGAGGALSGYGIQRQREQERMDELRYRQQQLDMRERELAESRARALRDEEREMGRLGYRVATRDEPTGPMTFRPRDVKIPEFDFDRAELARPQVIPAPKVEGGRIAGTGAAAAPGQTYSAIARALEDYTGPEVRPVVRERTYEGPEISIQAPELRGFERVQAGDRTYLRPDEELLKKVDVEREEEKKKKDIEDKARSIFDAFGGDISMEQADAIARSGADVSSFRMTPYQRASLANQRDRERGTDLDVLRNRVDTMIRRGKDEIIYRYGGTNPEEITRPYRPEEILEVVEQQARLYGKNPSDIYPDYNRIAKEIEESQRTQAARARFDVTSDLNGFNVGGVDLFDPEVEDMLQRSFGEGVPELQFRPTGIRQRLTRRSGG